MAFPGTYNISYYKGDTLEFRIYPKDSNGNPFPLSQYSGTSGTTKFTIASARGATEGSINGYAQISFDQTFILCAITPANGETLEAGTEYVYDVEIARTSSPYDFIYTLLTGTITVLEQVTPVGDISVPEPVTDIVADSSNGEIQLSWSANVLGPTPSSYNIYAIPYDPAFESTAVLTLLIGQLPTLEAFDSTDTSYPITETTAFSFGGINYPSAPLVPGLSYIFAIVAVNEVGPSSPAGNFNIESGTVAEVLVEGGS